MIGLTLYAEDHEPLTEQVEKLLRQSGAVFTRLTYADDPLLFDSLHSVPCLELSNCVGQALVRAYGYKPARILAMVKTQKEGGQVECTNA